LEGEGGGKVSFWRTRSSDGGRVFCGKGKKKKRFRTIFGKKRERARDLKLAIDTIERPDTGDSWEKPGDANTLQRDGDEGERERKGAISQWFSLCKEKKNGIGSYRPEISRE